MSKDQTLVAIMRDIAGDKKNAVGDRWGLHWCDKAADCIESLKAEVERLERKKEAIFHQFELARDKALSRKDRIKSLETTIEELSGYCPTCGSCGIVECCGIKCHYIKDQQKSYDDLVKEVTVLESKILLLEKTELITGGDI